MRKTMKAARMVALQQPLEVDHIPIPTPGKKDAIIRIEASGICRTDWHLWNGDWTWVGIDVKLPIILGHEFSGIVEEIGSQVKNIHVGDRVTVLCEQADGNCCECYQGRPNLCLNIVLPGITHNGGFARYTHVLNADINCIQLPDSIDFLTAATLGDRYMTAFHAVTAKGQVQPGQWVAVYGCGGVGLSIIQIANAMEALVIAVDIDDLKLEKARDEGAVATINARTTPDVPEAIKSLTNGGAHVSIDALGIGFTATNSIRSLRKAGRHVQVGLTSQQEQGLVQLPLDQLVSAEWQVVGSMFAPYPRYPDVFALIERGKLNPSSLITRQVALEDVSSVLQDMTDFKSIGFTMITNFD